MTREQVVQALTQYRVNKAKADYHAARIVQLRRQLRMAQDDMILDSQNLTAQLTGMPHGTGVSDQTANLAIKLADGWQSDRVIQAKKMIIQQERIEGRYRDLVTYVDAWLVCLKDRQRYVIMQKTIKGAFTRDVIDGLRSKYGETYSKNSIRRMEVESVDCIYNMVAD